MRRRTSPVQQWVDSLPSPAKSTTSSIASIVRQQSVSVDSESASIPECTVEQVYSDKENYIGHSNMTVSTPITVPNSPAITYPGVSRLARDPSFQSDSSHCSSVESLLELRRADPEAVLLSLGFGGCASSPQDAGPLSRIPKRFLQPSRLKGIAIDDFVRHQQETSESLDSTSLGYRGLTGSPYVAPSEIVQKIMQRLREHESQEAYLSCGPDGSYALPQQQEQGKLSVLSPDNRQYLERPRSKSPDMRNKRMIIGQRSFAFGRDGDLIEINPKSTQTSQESDDLFEFTDEHKSITNLVGPTLHQHRSRSPSTRLSSRTSSSSSSSSSSRSRSRSSSSSNSGKSPLEKGKPILAEHNRDSIETVIRAKTGKSLSDASELPADKSEPVASRGNTSRRASEGSCEQLSARSSLLEQEEGRRFSDGVMDSMKKNEAAAAAAAAAVAATSTPLSSSAKRKKSLKRQAKIRDSTSPSESADEVKHRRPTTLRLNDNRCSHCGKTEIEYDDEEPEAESCCYKRTSQNCWRRMEKVLKKNKKLENVVARNRREMAEIRDMLSILSCRVEPRF